MTKLESKLVELSRGGTLSDFECIAILGACELASEQPEVFAEHYGTVGLTNLKNLLTEMPKSDPKSKG